jgi:hypothetical protein
MEEIVNEECCELESAMRSGDDQRAIECAKKLAEGKSKVNLTVGNSSISPPADLIRS